MKRFWRWLTYHYEWYMYKWTWGLTTDQVHYCQQRVREAEAEKRFKKLLNNEGEYIGWELTIRNPL